MGVPAKGSAPDADLAFTPALELADRIRRGALSPVELVESYLRRIEHLDPTINSFITVAADQALAAAKRAEQRIGEADLPPFHGIPVSVKDLIDTAGIRTTYATSAWSARIPETDAAVITKLKAAGFIVLGKNNTPEFAGGIYTEPLAYGPCRNPWNPDYSPGGSSGGSGASEGAGLCAVALGGDDGGSIRIPSGWCGVFGVKPSRGRVSAAPDPAALYFTPGPMTHTVADAAAMLDAISGYVTGDWWWAPSPDRPFLEEVGRHPGRLRVAFTTNGADGVNVVPGNVTAVRNTARILDELGHEVVEVTDWPGRGLFPDERAVPLHVIYGAYLAARIDLGLAPPADQLEPGQQFLVEAGRSAKATDLVVADRLAAETSREVVRFFDRYDVFLTPVIASQPSRIGQFVEHPESALDLMRAIQFTPQFSVTGQPAVSVPALLDTDGIPVGVQLVGRPADEATLFRVARQLEEANPWIHRRPPLS